MKKEEYKICNACGSKGNWFIEFPTQEFDYRGERRVIVICNPCILKAIQRLTKKKKKGKV